MGNDTPLAGSRPFGTRHRAKKAFAAKAQWKNQTGLLTVIRRANGPGRVRSRAKASLAIKGTMQ